MSLAQTLRRFKLVYAAYNLLHPRQLADNARLYRRYGIGKPYFSPLSSRDFADLPRVPDRFDTSDSTELFPRSKAYLALSGEVQRAIVGWSDDGYAVLRDYFDADRIAAVNDEVARLMETGRATWRRGARIHTATERSRLLYDLAHEPRLLGLLELFLGREAELFQSVNFIEPSEQRTHSDFYHMTTYPEGNLIAVWIALEDVDEDNGPLHVYPGSHRLPCITNADFDNEGSAFWLGERTDADYEDYIDRLVRDRSLSKEIIRVKRGDVLVWHGNLLHGGEPRRNTRRTRRSMVLHYFAKDVIRYHEITQRPTLRPLAGRPPV